MADKSFGVKELNLLNASGTPTITSPNNLNLNANTVAISTSVTIGHNLTVSANAGIASLNVTGVSTFVGLTTFRSDIHIVGNQAIDINNNALLLRGNNGGNGFITNSIGHLYISSLNDVENLCTNNFSVKTNTSEQAILATKNGSVAIYHDGGNKKLETTTNGIDVTGAITVNGSATSAWTISNNSSSNYVISGPGGLSSANNPDLYLERGQTYQFIMNAAGHGFGIQTSSGTWNNSNAYTTGITNAGAATGVITFQVPYSAPDRLYYACTSGHSGMVGNIYISGASSDIKVADQWRYTGGQTITTQDVLLTGWERPDTSGTGGGAYLGGGMSQSNGIFSFPTTGIYLITFEGCFNGTNNTRYSEIDIVVTKNNSSYIEASRSFFYYNRPTGTSTGASCSCSFIMDVDNISNDKVRFESSQDNVGQHQVLGDSSVNLTTVTFLRLGAT